MYQNKPHLYSKETLNMLKKGEKKYRGIYFTKNKLIQ